MKKLIISSLLLAICLSGFSQILGYPDGLITKPEKTRYQETSLHSDVMMFVQLLDAGSDLVHSETIGTSKEGRNMPLVIMSNPGISSPEEAFSSGKPILYIQANIHGGEVEGKEASMIMMREIAFGQKKHLLDNQILLFCPIFNADGNDALSPNNRASQDGSPVEAGERYSGEGLDLNRDGLKLESIEGKALTENVILKWKPIMFVDLHTTNGTWHGYSLTYAPGMPTAGHPGTSRYLMENLFPEVSERVRERSGLDTYLYGNFSDFPPTQYNGMLTEPRYLTNSLALRNMFTILVETFAHDRFERRILSNTTYLTSLFEYTSNHAGEMKSLIEDIEGGVVFEIENSGGNFKKGVKFQRAQAGPRSDLLVYDTETNIDQFGIERNRRTGRRFWVSGVRKMFDVDIQKDATVPKAYIFPAELSNVAQKLRQHGIEVQELSGSSQFTGEEFTVTGYSQLGYNYQGHYLRTISGYFSNQTKSFPVGSYYVDMAQALAYLTFYLLEPETDDGLTVWNYFDSYLESLGVQSQDVAFPVFKILQGGASAENIMKEDNVSIYKSENQDKLNVQLNMPSVGDCIIIVSDQAGRRIETYTIPTGGTKTEIPLEKYSPGVYIIGIKSGDFQINRKVIIN